MNVNPFRFSKLESAIDIYHLQNGSPPSVVVKKGYYKDHKNEIDNLSHIDVEISVDGYGWYIKDK